MLSLGFLLRADADQAHEAIEKLEGATERAASAMEGNFVKASEGISRSIAGIVPAIGIASAAVTALGGTILALAQHAAEYGESIYTASIKTGLSAKELSSMAAVTKQTGESFDTLVMSLARMQRNIGEAMVNQVAIGSQALIRAAGGARELKEASHGGADGLEHLLKGIFALKEPSERNLALQALLGRGWQSNTKTLQFLADEGFGKAANKAKEFNMLLDDKQVAQAHSYVEEMDRLKAELSGVALQLGQALVPMLMTAEASMASLIPRLQQMALSVAGSMLVYAGAIKTGQALFDEADKKGKEAVTAQADALIHQEELVNAAYKNMHDPAAKARLDLDDLANKTKSVSEHSLELAANLEGMVHGLEQSSVFLPKNAGLLHLTAMNLDELTDKEKEYYVWVIKTLGAERQRFDERVREARQKVEAPDIGGTPTGMNEAAMAKMNEFNEQLAKSTQKNSLFTAEAAEHWRDYYDTIAHIRTALPFLTISIEGVVKAHQAGMPTLIGFAKALRDEGEAAQESAKKQVEANAQSMFSHLVGRKAMAIIEAIVETARGIADLAQVPPLVFPAAMHFMSAAEWGKIAGTSSGGHGGGGGGASKGQSESVGGGSGSPGVAGGGGGGGGGGGTQHQSIVNIYGGQITDTHNLQQLTAALNTGGNSGTVRLNTGGSSYSIPSPAY